jgi:hypothetical protein
MHGFRDLKKRLAGHAAGPGAIAAQTVFLDDGHFQAQPGGKLRRGKPGGTSPNDNQVVFLAYRFFTNE